MLHNHDVPQQDCIPLVAIVASAEALEPLDAFLQAVPEGFGAAYVIVQPGPSSPSFVMRDFLAGKFDLAIKVIEDGTHLASDTIFLSGPNMHVELEGAVFRAFPDTGAGCIPRRPIDRLFTSLSSRDWSRTVAVVLAGCGSDGAQGAQVLHDAGAAVLVQSGTDIPVSISAPGPTKSGLGAADMPRAIKDIFAEGKQPADPAQQGYKGGVLKILERLEQQQKVDFNQYKPTDVNRGLVRGLHVRGHGNFEEYAEAVAQNDDIANAVFEDLLIGATEFYRDAEAMTALRQKVLDLLAKAEPTGPPLKIWIPACARGEEVYTIAIELNEALRATGSDRQFRIFATDVHAKSVENASYGVYTKAKVASVPKALLARYFDVINGQYVVDPLLRQKIVFSVHNLTSDPPFMNLDLISCRNLMIYLREEPRASVLSMFLFGLRENGYLFLGASESVGQFTSPFEVIDARWRIFRKQARADDQPEAAFSPRGPRPGADADGRVDSDLTSADKLLFNSAPVSRSGDIKVWTDDRHDLVQRFQNLKRQLRHNEAAMEHLTQQFDANAQQLMSLKAEQDRNIAQLSELNASTETVLRALNAGVLVLGADKKIVRFSQLVEQAFCFQQCDVHQPIKTTGPRLDFADLSEIADKIATGQTPQLCEGTFNRCPVRLEAHRHVIGSAGAEAQGVLFLFIWL